MSVGGGGGPFVVLPGTWKPCCIQEEVRHSSMSDSNHCSSPLEGGERCSYYHQPKGNRWQTVCIPCHTQVKYWSQLAGNMFFYGFNHIINISECTRLE